VWGCASVGTSEGLGGWADRHSSTCLFVFCCSLKSRPCSLVPLFLIVFTYRLPSRHPLTRSSGDCDEPSAPSGRTCGCARAAGGTCTCCTTVVAVDDHVGTVLPQINGSGGVEHDDALNSHPNTSVRLFIALASRCGVTSTITLATAWVHASHYDRTFAPMRRRQVLFLDTSKPYRRTKEISYTHKQNKVGGS